MTMRNTIIIDRTMNNFSSVEKATRSLNRATASMLAAGRGTSKYQAILESLKERYAEAERDETLERTGDMSLTDYKEYVNQVVEGMPTDDSRSRDTVAIDMTDACLVHMRDDPEYENWVMDAIRSALASKNQTSEIFGGSYITMRFGSEKGDFSIETGEKNGGERMDMFSTNSKTRGSFMTKQMTKLQQTMMTNTLMAAQKARLASAISSYNAASGSASGTDAATNTKIASATLSALMGDGASSYTSILSSLTGDYRVKGTSLVASYLMMFMGGSSMASFL